MSEQQYTQIINLKLSEPVPISLMPVILRFIRQGDCPGWLKDGLSRLVENSLKIYN